MEGFERYLADAESPASFITWGALYTIAAALGRRAYFRRGHSAIFPNQYVVLVGPSGCRKSDPVVLAQRLLRHLGVDMIPETITRQALYRHMGKQACHWKDPDGFASGEQCPVTGIYEELAVFLGEHDLKFLADLTNWYDCRDKWTYESKHQGTDEIVGVCFNMLGAMAPDWLPGIIPNTAVGGGFTSRVIFVVEHQKRKTVADPDVVSAQDDDLFERLCQDLERIQALQGRFSFTAPAKEAYMAWYTEQDALGGGIKDPRFGGYNSRRATHLIKIGMLVSAARGDTKEIELADFERARALLEAAEARMPGAFSLMGLSAYNQQRNLLVNVLATAGKISRSELLALLQNDLDLGILRELIAGLEAARRITVRPGRDPEYVWTPQPRAQIRAPASPVIPARLQIVRGPSSDPSPEDP